MTAKEARDLTPVVDISALIADVDKVIKSYAMSGYRYCSLSYANSNKMDAVHAYLKDNGFSVSVNNCDFLDISW